MNKLLFVIYSCVKRRVESEQLYEMITAKIDAHVIILHGNPSKNISCINDDNVTSTLHNNKYLYIDVYDGYEGLSQKTYQLFKAVDKYFNGYNCIKCDDDLIPNIKNLNDIITVIKNKDPLYAGNTTHASGGYSSHHLHYNVHNTFKMSKFIPKCYYCTGVLYYVKFDVIKLIIQKPPLCFFEDIYIGKLLNDCNIYPTHIDCYSNYFNDYNRISIQNINSNIKKIYITLHARFGNQLFQLFSGYGLSKKTNKILILVLNDQNKDTYIQDFVIKHNNLLCITHKSLSNLKIKTYNEDHLSENHCCRYNKCYHDEPNNMHINGYLQNEKYFIDYKTEIMLMLKNKEIEQSILKKYPNICDSYFIHYRRGDYVKEPVYKIDYDTYFKKSIEFITTKTPTPNFYIFSDDINFCKSYKPFNLKNTTFVCNLNYIETCYAMSLCLLGGICSNSTFSWWGSYMNPNELKTVIFPKQWFTTTSKPVDVYPKNSIIL